jgi:hypothetical protein
MEKHIGKEPVNSGVECFPSCLSRDANLNGAFHSEIDGKETIFPARGILEQDVKNRHNIETSNPPLATKAIIRIGRVLTQTQTLPRTAFIVETPWSFLQGKSSA